MSTTRLHRTVLARRCCASVDGSLSDIIIASIDNERDKTQLEQIIRADNRHQAIETYTEVVQHAGHVCTQMSIVGNATGDALDRLSAPE